MNRDRFGLYDGGLIVPAECAKYIYSVSHWGYYTGYFGYSTGHPILGAIVALCACSSQLYWQRPTYGWRRNFDVACVQLSLWAHFFSAMYTVDVTRDTPGVYYYPIVGVGSIAFMASWVLSWMDAVWLATYAHLIVHLCANVSCIVLYLN